MKLFFVMSALALTGCTAGMNSDFSCSGIDGIEGCVSLNEMNTMVDNGQFATDSQGNVFNKPSGLTAKPQALPERSASFTEVNPPLMAGKPTRAREEVRQITVFPYIDSQGNYHDTSVIYTVIEPSRWVVTPPKPAPVLPAVLPPLTYPKLKGAL